MTRREFYLLFAILFSLVSIALAGIRHFAGENRARAEEGQKAHDFACAIDGNLRRRVAEGQALLDAHPKAKVIDADPGPEEFLVSREFLISSIARDWETITITKAIDLRCTSAEKATPPTTTTTKGTR